MVRRKGNLHSRFVTWTKIVLPMIALAILSSLFLFSKSNDLTRGIQLSPSDLEQFSQKERITDPRYGGMTTDGIAILISASEASPQGTDGTSFLATDIKAEINMPDGTIIKLTAKLGEVDSQKKVSSMTNGVTLHTSDGYIAKTQGLRFMLNVLDIKSEGSVDASGPLGHLTAGSLHLTAKNTAPDTQQKASYLLVFKNGVKLIYNPQEEVAGEK